MQSSPESKSEKPSVSKSKQMQLDRLAKSKIRNPRPRPLSPSPSGEASALKDAAPSSKPGPEQEPAVNVEVEEHPSNKGPFSISDSLRRAGQKLKEGLTLDDTEPRRGKARKAAGTEEGDFYSLVTMGLVLVLTVSRVPKEVRPNEDEIHVFSKHLSSIIVRHVPALGNLSPDAMDIIGLLIVTNSYYARVSEDLKRLRAPRIIEGRAANVPPEAAQPSPQPGPQAERPMSDIGARAPRLDAFLNEAEQHAGGAA